MIRIEYKDDFEIAKILQSCEELSSLRNKTADDFQRESITLVILTITNIIHEFSSSDNANFENEVVDDIMIRERRISIIIDALASCNDLYHSSIWVKYKKDRRIVEDAISNIFQFVNDLIILENLTSTDLSTWMLEKMNARLNVDFLPGVQEYYVDSDICSGIYNGVMSSLTGT